MAVELSDSAMQPLLSNKKARALSQRPTDTAYSNTSVRCVQTTDILSCSMLLHLIFNIYIYIFNETYFFLLVYFTFKNSNK